MVTRFFHSRPSRTCERRKKDKRDRLRNDDWRTDKLKNASKGGQKI